MPTFNIVDGQDLSLLEVRIYQEGGGSVLRSAHIGNFDATTLFLAQERFPIILHEHVRGTMKGYEPGAVILRGEKLQIADKSELPVTHESLSGDLRVQAIVEAMIGRIFNPAHAHCLALQKLFPDNVQLASELLLDQRAFLSRALSELSSGYPHLFHKYVTSDGEVLHLSEPQSAREQIYVSSSGRKVAIDQRKLAHLSYKYLQDTIGVVYGGPVHPEGTVMNANLYILLSAISEVYRGRRGEARFRSDEVTVLHFSGYAMMRYMITNTRLATYNQRTINAIYEYLWERLPGELPERINFVIVPTAALRDFISWRPPSGNGFRNISQYDVLAQDIRLEVADWVFSASQRDLRVKHSLIKKPSSVPSVYRDLSYCIDADATDEQICDAVGRTFDYDDILLWEVRVLARTPFENLPEVARQRLGAREHQHNVLVRIVLKHPEKKLTKEQVNEICRQLYPRLQKGSKRDPNL